MKKIKMAADEVNQNIHHMIGEWIAAGDLHIHPIGEHQQRTEFPTQARSGSANPGRANCNVVSSKRKGPCIDGP